MSECGVCIGGGDVDGYAEMYNVAWPKARKEHRCGECKCVIDKGDIYQCCTGKWDGKMFAEKTCAGCADIRHVYSCGETEPCFGSLWHDFNECDGFSQLKMAGECWDSLSADGKAKLTEQWRKWKGL